MKCRRVYVTPSGIKNIVWFGVKNVITRTTEVVSEFSNGYLSDDLTYDNFIIRHPELQGLLESLEVDTVTYGDITQRDVTGLKFGNASRSGNIKIRFKYEIISVDVYVTQYKQEKDTSCYVNDNGQQITAEQDDEPQKMTFTINSDSFYIATKNLKLNNEADYRMWLKKLVIRFNEKIVEFQNENDKHDNYSSEKDAIKDSLMQRLSVIKNELRYDYNYGIPLIDKLNDKATVDAWIIREINKHPDVNSIKEFASEIVDRVYSCFFILDTVYGEVMMGI